MYNTYVPNYTQQTFNDKIDNQIAQLQQLKNHTSVPAINQTFQLANNREVIRYSNSMDDVQREMVIGDTPFFSKDMSVVWIKNIKGEIKTYELKEIIPKDEKDLKIDFLMAQIEELKKGLIKNESNANVDESTTDADKSEESATISTVSKSNKKSTKSE